MRPDLKSWHCADHDSLSTWVPDDNDVVYWLELTLGPEDSETGDRYLVCVATPSGLASTYGQAIAPACSRGPVILLKNYSWANVLAEINRRLDAASSPEWPDVQKSLGRHFSGNIRGNKLEPRKE